jgi:hypothetical protein
MEKKTVTLPLCPPQFPRQLKSVISVLWYCPNIMWPSLMLVSLPQFLSEILTIFFQNSSLAFLFWVFAKFPKANVRSSCLFLRSCVPLEKAGSKLTIFYGILCFRIFRKSVESRLPQQKHINFTTFSFMKHPTLAQNENLLHKTTNRRHSSYTESPITTKW